METGKQVRHSRLQVFASLIFSSVLFAKTVSKMADDIDDLLDEVEEKYVPKKTSKSVAKRGKTTRFEI